MRVSSSTAPVLIALTVMVGAAGCSDGPAPETDPTVASSSATPRDSQAPSTDPAETGTPVPEPSVPPFPAGTAPRDGGRGSGHGLGVTGVSTARHPGYDRVVFDLGGTGTPGWSATYTANPRYEGSGDTVALEGDTFLMVVLDGVGLPYDTGLEPFGDTDTRLPGSGTEGIAEIAPGGVLEGQQQAFIALTGGKRPYRVVALESPARLIVDVAHH